LSARPSESHLSAAEQRVRDAVAAARLWPSDRNAGSRALREIDAAIREMDDARVALAHEIAVEIDRVLAADPTRCAAEWGVCPEHGNALSSSGRRTWCNSSSWGRTWPGSRLTSHCTEPAVVIVADGAGGETRLCVGHWIDARARLVGARLVRTLPDTGRDMSADLDS
jgi:hypothetical protein